MSLQPKPTRSEQRDQARAKARDLREKRAQGDKRKRLIARTSVIVGIIAVVVGVTLVVMNLTTNANNQGVNAKKVPANVTKLGGVILGKDLLPVREAEANSVNRIVIYQDYQCPVCKLFEDPNSSQIKSWVQSGLATVEYHPISFLDGQSLNNYSSRATNAALCVANSQPAKFFDFNTALYANQPQENSAGPSDQAIKDTMRSVGVDVNSEMNSCIDQKRYSKYIDLRTSEAFSQPAVTGKDIPKGTPHILVNGNYYDWNGADELVNPGRFAQFFTTHQKKN